ncbi:MAG: monosaccharide transporter substrate-binding protein family [Naasia sp.]|jgi:ribose transport system substrate-binding protein|uniref:substrate-binding domain-containing protein n=1 Tax=Naasia sp. TaxID=2546198 RepID=UPI0026307472|nr:substrate-binding domain-containing protein [Naasia sp.]MCU1570896.1 monosaccharide transporter substrate-binding protein family [Naasia sp.]
MKQFTRTRSGRLLALGALTATSLMVITGCASGSSGGGSGGGGSSTGTGGSEAADYVIGVSNTLAGNGWREEMICSVKAEALASGKVSKVIAISKNGGPTEQIQDLQSLISQGVNAIILNPADREKLNPIIAEAEKKGIVVVAVDSPVTDPDAYIAVNDQKEWGRMNAEWLFTAMGGKGKFLYMRGIEGVPADTDRDAGVQEALKDFPDITYKEVWTGWDYTKGGEIAVQEFSAGKYQGVWTSGTDYTVVNAFETAGVDPVPVTGQETNAFLGQLIDGAPGAYITNPAIIGGVGANIAIRALAGETVDKQTILTPRVIDAKTGMDEMKASYDPDQDALYNATFQIEGQTTFTPEQLKSCKGPGE